MSRIHSSTSLSRSSRAWFLLSSLLAASVASAAIPASEATQRWAKLPEPTEVVPFKSLPQRMEGATVKVAVTIDEHGNASNVRAVPALPADVSDRILPVVAQWKFSPAEDRNGRAVPIRVVYPLRLVPEDNRKS